MNTIRRLSIVAVSSAALGVMVTAPVSAEVGKILFVNGAVMIVSPDGQSRPAQRGEVLQAGERVVTAAGAMSQVKMLDGGRVGIRERSRVHFEPKQSGEQRLGLDTGAVRVVNVKTRDTTPPKMIIKTADGQMDLKQGDALAVHNKPSDPAAKPETVVKLLRGEGVAKHVTGTEKSMKSAEVSAFKRGAPGFESRKPDLLARFEGPVPRKPGGLDRAPAKGRESLSTPLSGKRLGAAGLTRNSRTALTPLKQTSLPSSGLRVASVARAGFESGAGLKPVMPASRLKPTVIPRTVTVRSPALLPKVGISPQIGARIPITTLKPVTIKPVIRTPPTSVLRTRNSGLKDRLLGLK